jgi:CRP/FNR family cyclic AMP-dependent transcriptional regulator
VRPTGTGVRDVWGAGKMSSDTPDTVRAVTAGFLDELDATARATLETQGRRRRFDAGSALFVEGDVGTKVVVIHSGHVKVTSTSEAGHTIVLAVRGPGDILGDLSAIDGEARSASGFAIDDVEAQIMSAESFRELLDSTPGVALVLLRVIVSRIRDSDRLRLDFGARDTAGRVALRLVELAETLGEPCDGGIRITVPLTQEDLAGWVAASREAVARALASLRRRDLIRTARREITILDLDRLRDAAG